MSKEKKFSDEIKSGYSVKGKSLLLGGAILDGEVLTEHFVRIPLKTMNRHGLIAGATGTGKTKTLQILAEQLSNQGIPSLVMDVKGDLSGIAVPSNGHKKIDERHAKIGFPFIPGASPVEFLSLSEEPGARMRATISEFGPVLLSKLLDLSEAQVGVLTVVFKYCDDNKLPLLDLKDLKETLKYFTGAGKEEIKAEYGSMSTRSIGTIMRKMIELEQQGGELFFGEASFDPNDLVHTTEDKRGVVNILRLTDIQDKPLLFSTFMLQLLAEIYEGFPEIGDSGKPKLVIFIDEAHLVFKNASKALLSQIETIVKLIRSKGVGLYFVTQNPVDIPEDVLAQLGLKIQHALRAFTAKDRKAIKLASQNYPESDFYDVEELLTSVGIGEALVTALNEEGIPTPLVHTMLRAPQSRMDILSKGEIDEIIDESELIPFYNKVIDRKSAYEILKKKIETFNKKEQKEKKRKSSSSGRRKKSTFEKVVNSTTTRQIGRTVAREITRSILGVFGIKTPRRRRKRRGWF